MTKLHKEKLRENFRPKLRVNEIAQITKSDSNHIYKCVRYDERFDPNADRVDKYCDRGWEIVTSTQQLADDRKNAPGADKEDALRQKPVTKPGRDGALFVLMRISQEQFKANKDADLQRDLNRYIASSKGTMKRMGENVSISLPEVNETNVNIEGE
jgi:hypothetical protein